jgi:hypothetical protein
MSTLEIVGYDNIQFTKAQNVLRGMGLEQLSKNEKAKQELAKFIPERREAFMPSRSGTHNPRDDLAVI